MKLLFKQRFFSWLDSYDIYDEMGNTVYTVKGELSWGHKLQIYNADGLNNVSSFFIWPIYSSLRYIANLGKKVKTSSLIVPTGKPSFILDYNDWKISGNFWEWDYEIIDSRGIVIGDINKELFNFTDTYSLTISDPRNAIYVLMIALAIDAQKCSNNS